jgi:hypothetical protein
MEKSLKESDKEVADIMVSSNGPLLLTAFLTICLGPRDPTTEGIHYSHSL